MTSPPRRGGPLAGMKVLDLSHVMAGPTCTLLLADLGADVIKIERPPHGDDSRRMTPPAIAGEAAAFMMVNRNKRGIVIDLKTPSGAEVFRRLVAGADVLVENFSPGVMERLGLGFDELRQINRGLIHCSITGFGRTGPYRDRRGFDLIAQAMSGIMSCTGSRSDGEPVKCGPPVSDITAGILAALGVVAAYARKLQTGEGQQVDTSLFEAALVQTYWQSAIALATGVAPQPLGSGHPLSAPYQAFQTRDRWIVVGGANQTNWIRLLEALDARHLADDPRFETNGARMANLPALEAELGARFRCEDAEHWLRKLDALGVPCAPVQDMNAALSDPQTIARQMVVEVEHARAGTVRTLGLPIKLSDTPGGVRRAAPVFAEHTREVLEELGYGADEVARLAAEGAVVVTGPAGQDERS